MLALAPGAAEVAGGALVGLVPEIPADAWRVADPSGIWFGYLPGLAPDATASIVAYEPGLFGKERLVLFSNGEVAALSAAALRAALRERDPK